MEQKEGTLEGFVEKITRKRRRKGEGDATIPVIDPIRPDSDPLGSEAELLEPTVAENATTPTIKENLMVEEPALAKAPEKNYAEFLLVRSGNLLACRRSSCGRKAYPIGGSLGSLTLEKLAERQGWKISKGKEIHRELSDGKRIAWFDGQATMLKRYGTNPIWTHFRNVQDSDHIHEEAIDIIFGA